MSQDPRKELTPAEHLLETASYLLDAVQDCDEGQRIARYMLNHIEGAAELFPDSSRFHQFRLVLTMLIEMHDDDRSFSEELALAGPRNDEYTKDVIDLAWKFCHFDLILKMVHRLQLSHAEKAAELGYWRAKISIEKSNWVVVKRQLKRLQKLSSKKYEQLLWEVRNSGWGNVLSEKGFI